MAILPAVLHLVLAALFGEPHHFELFLEALLTDEQHSADPSIKHCFITDDQPAILSLVDCGSHFHCKPFQLDAEMLGQEVVLLVFLFLPHMLKKSYYCYGEFQSQPET